MTEDPGAGATVIGQWMLLALCERDNAAARKVLAAISPEGSEELGVRYPKAWYEGVITRALGYNEAAGAAFTIARVDVEKTVREQPDAPPRSLCSE